MTRSLIALFSFALLGCPMQGPQGFDAPIPAGALSAVSLQGAIYSPPEEVPALQSEKEDLGPGAPEIFKKRKKQKKSSPHVVAREGEQCGGAQGLSCEAGLFCNMTEADGLTCGAPGRAGVCAPVPTVCTRDYRPVCGCDGKTYSNDCQRQAAGVARAHMGACQQQEPSPKAPDGKAIPLTRPLKLLRPLTLQ